MARRQKELPNTRLPHEPAPPEPIRELDDACDALEKAKGKATRAGQGVVAAKKAAQDLLDQHNRDEYEYESNGVLKKIFRKKTLGSCKVKVEKKRDDDSDDGDDE